jgi:hypothetical protein
MPMTEAQRLALRESIYARPPSVPGGRGMVTPEMELEELEAMWLSLEADPWHARNLAEEGVPYILRLRASCPTASFRRRPKK